jgi:hypothetical protein
MAPSSRRLLLAPLLLLLLAMQQQRPAHAAEQQEAASIAANAAGEPVMSDERVVFQTAHGDIEFAFFPQVRVELATVLDPS